MAKQRSSGDAPTMPTTDDAAADARVFSRGGARCHAFGADTLGRRSRETERRAPARKPPAARGGESRRDHAVGRRPCAAMKRGACGDGRGALSFQRARGAHSTSCAGLRRGLYPIEMNSIFTDSVKRRRASSSPISSRRSRDAGCRCVRIIHGKGYRSGARGPVLKAAVNLWLRRHLDVMAFVSARGHRRRRRRRVRFAASLVLSDELLYHCHSRGNDDKNLKLRRGIHGGRLDGAPLRRTSFAAEPAANPTFDLLTASEAAAWNSTQPKAPERFQNARSARG